MKGKMIHQPLPAGRILLREPRLSDADDIFVCLSDPEVCRYIEVSLHQSPADTKAFLFRKREEFERCEGTEWVIEYGLEKRAVGMINLYSFSADSAYVGYFIARDFWGRGIATEALSVLKEYAFSCGLSALYALCFPENRASLRVLEKAGFGFEKKGEYFGSSVCGDLIFRYVARKLHE